MIVRDVGASRFFITATPAGGYESPNKTEETGNGAERRNHLFISLWYMLNFRGGDANYTAV